MQLYKKRSFGELISDTFNFFRTYGKNYFKNYLLLNGGVLIFLTLVFVIGFRDIIAQFFSGNMNNQSFYFEDYFTQNTGVFIVSSLLIFALFVLLSLINYAYPIIYLDLVGKTGRTNYTAGEFVEQLKAKAGKLFIFFVGFLFIFTPLALLAFLVSGLLAFLIIGIFILIILVPILMNIVNFTLYDYLLTDNGYFKSLKKGFNIQFSSNFWKYVGSSLIVYFLIQTISSFFSLIPAFILGFMSVASSANDMEESGLFIILLVVTYAIAILASLIMTNAIYVNAGFMYFDGRDDLQREVHLEEIDSIGSYE